MSQLRINRKFLILLLGILAALGPFTIDMYLPGFDQISQEFHVSMKEVTFTLTSYFIGISIGQLIYGPLVDKYGRKRPLLIGLGVFALSAFGCFLSGSIQYLIFLRFTQALGGCVGMVASNAIISDVFKREEMAKAFSSILLVMGVAPIIAPTLGGFIIEYQSWRSIFLYLTIASVLVMIMIGVFLPETHTGNRRVSLRIMDVSMTYWKVLKNKEFLIYSIIASISMSILFAYISLASDVFIKQFHLSEKIFGILFGINALGFISGSTINSQLLKRFEIKKLTQAASLIQSIIIVISLFTYSFLTDIPYYFVVISIFLSLFFLGIIIPNTSAMSLSPFQDNRGFASALSGSIRMAFASIVSAIMGAVMMNSLILLFITFTVLGIISLALIMYTNIVGFNSDRAMTISE